MKSLGIIPKDSSEAIPKGFFAVSGQHESIQVKFATNVKPHSNRRNLLKEGGPLFF